MLNVRNKRFIRVRSLQFEQRVEADEQQPVTGFGRVLGKRALHLQPGPHRTLGVVFVRHGGPENGHELVADDLVEASAVGCDVVRETFTWKVFARGSR